MGAAFGLCRSRHSLKVFLRGAALNPAFSFPLHIVDSEPYEGRFGSPAAGAPFVLLVHDWDGLTDYEAERTAMLEDLRH